MRTDTSAFAAKNLASAKRPRYVIELAFDSDSTILWYFTSHTDCALPGGASSILEVIEDMSGTSQKLNPDTANASIGNINFKVVDKASVVTTTLGSQLFIGRSTRRQRVRVYVGFEGLAWADYTLVQTQLVTEIAYSEGAYKFTCADVQREMRKDIFELGKTTLASSISASDTNIPVFNTDAFEMLAHGSSYTDSPNSTVGYIKIQDEVIRYTGKTSTFFTVCTRGALNTRAVEHVIDGGASSDRRTAVEEYVYLELPAVDLMYRLLTGKDRLGNEGIPSAWNLGIPTSYVRLADFTGIGADIWDTANDANGFIVRFEGLSKTDGKKFIESELALLSGVFTPVYADGALGLKRMSSMLAGAAYVTLLDNSNLVDVGDLVHDFNALHNVLQISWNWEVSKKDFTRVNLLIDAASVAIHGEADPLKIKFRGLHGSRHSSTIISQRFDSLRDRYTGPPQLIDVSVLPSLNTLEVGDVVRLKPAGVRDFVAIGDLDRSFEIQNVSIDWITGALKLKLFGSSQAAGAIAATADATVLPNSWYSSQGTNLSSVLTITGTNPGHVSANGTLVGVSNMNDASAIYYYTGDLVIDPGVTLTVVDNIQLRIPGFLQNNGAINGLGRGMSGAVAIGSPASESDYNPGTAGFIGTTEAGGGIFSQSVIRSTRGGAVVGANQSFPAVNLSWDGTTLSGIPGDMRGSSGSSGMPYVDLVVDVDLGHPGGIYTGGAGGAGGAGLAIVSRGFAQGVTSSINLSGADGTASSTVTSSPPFLTRVSPGSGAGGAPGGLLILLDGAYSSATDLTETGFVALNGKTPIGPGQMTSPQFNAGDAVPDDWYSYFVGTGDGTTFARPSLSGSRGGNRVQYVPGIVVATIDQSSTLTAPTNLGLESGTDQLLIQSDGTIVTRILVTWTPSLDSRSVGNDLQFKLSSESIWTSAPLILDNSTSAAFISGVADGMAYDVRLRAAGATREVSVWVTITSYVVLGKTERSSDVTLFTIEGTVLSWSPVADLDRAGYLLRYQPGTSRSWGDSIQLHEGLLTSSPYDLLIVPGGVVTLMIKAVDTSGNESLNAAYIVANLGDPLIANVVETFDRKAAGFPGTTTNGSVSGGNLVADSITPLAWKPDESADAWATDPATIAWATLQYATMTYIDTLTFSQALNGSQLTIQRTINGDPWSIEYRENSPNLAWNVDSGVLAWNADSSTLAWDQPAYLPWPGQITVNNSMYDFRIVSGQANTQGVISELTMTVDAPDISETLDNIVISSGGTRLPITNSYTVIKNVQLTVQADGGSAISARVDDKNATLGPLIHGLDAGGSNTSALVDANIQGY